MDLDIIGMAQAASRLPIIQVVHLVPLQVAAAATTSIGILLRVAVAVVVMAAVPVAVLIAPIRVAAAADPELTLTGVAVAVGPILRVVALLHPGVAALVPGIVVHVIANIQHILAVVHILVQAVMVRVIRQVAAVAITTGMIIARVHAGQVVPPAEPVVAQLDQLAAHVRQAITG